MSGTTLLCLPPAGAGAAFFRPWVGSHPGLRVVPVQLPGREKRFAEPECRDVGTLLDVIVPELLRETEGADRVAVFGHSFGAFLAHETARALAREAPHLDLVLVPSGATPPGTPRAERITGLPDDAFVAGVRRIAGYHHPALDDPELRELLLPPLRTDIAMQEDHRPAPAGPSRFPVLSVRGADDDVVSAAAAGAWRDTTTGPFRLVELPGGHMYLVDSWRPLLDLLAHELGGLPAGAR
ncbi:thioesterase II family protein [Streptomyces collinus]|uniref:thioesterase II family protein n=1 Tax=Streptomyces collinus TaxID=42684 RepID=UPI0033C35F79